MTREFRLRVLACTFLAAGCLAAHTMARPAAESTEIPEALAAGLQNASVSALRTAKLEWSLWDSRATPGGGPARTRFFTSVAAGDDYIVTHNGDEEGVVLRDHEGKPAKGNFSGSLACYRAADRIWMRRAGAPYAEVWEADVEDMFTVVDLRRIVMAPTDTFDSIPARLRASGSPPLRYTQEERDGLTVVTAVTARTTDGEYAEFIWWLDPSRNYAATRMRVQFQGKLAGETRIEHFLKDGVWFPRRLEQYKADGDGNLKIDRVYEVLQAEFNRPEHPAKLGPAALGLEPGMNVRHQGQLAGEGLKIWDGAGLISPAEYRERIAAGAITPGPTVDREVSRALARSERAKAGQPDVEWERAQRALRDDPIRGWRRTETVWEVYTRAFIQRYGLDGEQSELAWRLCAQCQDQAGHYLRPRHDELEAIEKRMSAAGDSAEQARHQQTLERLLAPIGEIFEKKLKAGLEKIPTPAQRAKVDG